MAQLEREFSERHKYESLLRELLDAQRNRKSEQLSKDQLSLFEAAWKAAAEAAGETEQDDANDPDDPSGTAQSTGPQNAAPRSRRGRRPVIVAKHCDHQPLHRQEQMFERHGVEISRKTMRRWAAGWRNAPNCWMGCIGKRSGICSARK